MDETTSAPVRRENRGGPLELVVFDGPRVARFPLGSGSVVVGREAPSDARVESSSVSRTHARFSLGETLTVTDLGSKNGTSVGGARLAPGVAHPIDVNVIVVLGDVQIVVRPAHSDGQDAVPSRSLRGMDEVDRLVGLVAPTDLSVLLLGETGVGKEVVAQQLHERSLRKKGKLVRINCAALPSELVESELFGHEKGAFSGAQAKKIGIFEEADGGTVVLDELGELPLAAQAKLLRTLESNEVRRVGSVQPRKVDMRVIASTNRDLAEMVKSGTFRADLHFRLDGITIHIPPLRDRPGDIVRLATLFLDEASKKLGRGSPKLTEDALAALSTYGFPGNVRELKKIVERALVLSKGEEISPRDLHLPTTRTPAAEAAPPDGVLQGERDKAEKAAILAALEACNGNQTRAAERLGIARRTLVDRLDKYGIARPRK